MEAGSTQCNPGFLLKTCLHVAEANNSKFAKKFVSKKKICQMNEFFTLWFDEKFMVLKKRNYKFSKNTFCVKRRIFLFKSPSVVRSECSSRFKFQSFNKFGHTYFVLSW